MPQQYTFSDLGLSPAGNGTTDDSSVFLSAVNAVSTAGGGTLLLDPVDYRIAATVEVPSGVYLRGAGAPETRSAAGTKIKHDTTAACFSFTGGNSKDAGISDLTFYQVHPNPSDTYPTAWVPTSPGREACILVDGTLGRTAFDNLGFHGVVRGIRAINNAGRLDIGEIRGQFFHSAVEIIRANDVTRVDYIHSWPYWSSNKNVLDYQIMNSRALVFGRSDGCWVGDVFQIFGYSAVSFLVTGEGQSSKLTIEDIYSDLTRLGVEIQQPNTNVAVGRLIHQGNHHNQGATPISGSASVYIDPGATMAYLSTGYLHTIFSERSIWIDGTQEARVDVGSSWVRDTSNLVVMASSTGSISTVHYSILPRRTGSGATSPVLTPLGTNGQVYAPLQILYQGMNNPEVTFYSIAGESATAGNFVRLQPQGPDANIQAQLNALGDANVILGAPANRRIVCRNPFALQQYNSSTLPAAATYPASMVYYTSGSGNKKIIFNDGTTWRYMDGTAI